MPPLEPGPERTHRATSVWIFHGRHQNRVDRNQQSFGERLTLVEVTRPGKNALDFHLSFYMGYIAARHPDARFVVISNDKGYLPMLEHASELGFAARHLGFTTPRRGLKAPAKKKAAPRKTSAKKAAPPTEEAAGTRTSARKMVAAAPARPAPTPGKGPKVKEAAKAKQAPLRPRPLRLT